MAKWNPYLFKDKFKHPPSSIKLLAMGTKVHKNSKCPYFAEIAILPSVIFKLQKCPYALCRRPLPNHRSHLPHPS